ncbi:MAG: N-acetylmuramoyl-L-alanine amidase [Candidatus Omnitrophota bacterium]|jgi:N-acetylmuramoyl-L-alanine amidase
MLQKFFFLLVVFCVSLICGCQSVPVKSDFVTYSINGIKYLPLVNLCNARGIALEYDTYTRTIVLTKNTHKINLRISDKLALIDGNPRYLKSPVDVFQGTVVVPYKFKEDILDGMFQDISPVVREFPLGACIKKIIIDAGHGGKDPGAIGKTGLKEKDVNLDIAKRLASMLEKDRVTVVLTRSVDRFISLARRVDIANESNADLFVSIHSNANRVHSMSGFEVYYVSPSVGDSERALQSAKNAIPQLGLGNVSALSLEIKAVLWDMVYTAHRAESIELSRSICKTINRNLDVEILGVKDARYAVLKGARMPAILIEVGFVSNSKEERYLKNYYYRQKIAESIREGLVNYAQDISLTQVKK